MRAFTRGNGRRVGMTHTNEQELRGFRELVAVCALDAGARPLPGAVSLTVTFVFPRPKSHFGQGRNAGVLKDSAPRHMTKMPDVDKCVRSVSDSLIDIAFHDDSQITQVTARKVYVTPNSEGTMNFPMPCTEVAIAYLEVDAADAAGRSQKVG